MRTRRNKDVQRIDLLPGQGQGPVEVKQKKAADDQMVVGRARGQDWQAQLGQVSAGGVEKVKETSAVSKSSQVATPNDEQKPQGRFKRILNAIKNDRSLKKMLTWRATASLDTAVIATFLADSASHGAVLGGLEVVTKMGIKYAHEKIWAKIDPEEKRTMARALTYRGVAAVDTLLLGWLIMGSPAAALGLVGIEFFTKIGLHWVHDKAWEKFAPVKKDDAQAELPSTPEPEPAR